MEIDITKCPKEPSVEVYKGDEYQFTINSGIEFDYLRLQIAENKYTDYSVKYNGEFIPIDAQGRLHYPLGLYDQLEDIISKLLLITL